MFTPTLPDPREYAHDTPKNSLVLAFRAWQSAEGGEREQAEAHVRFLIEQALASGDDKLVGIALSLMPSATAYRTFWSWVQQATWMHPQARLWPFAVPVVIVAASARPLSIPGQLADVSALRDIWARHGLFDDLEEGGGQGELWLSNRLINAAGMQSVRPTMAWQWSCLEQAAHEGWPQLPPAADLQGVSTEAAYLRFIPAIYKGSQPPQWPRNASGWGRDVSQWLSGLLGASGATVLALPRAPQPLLSALEDGRRAQQDIAGQLFLGNAIRQFREQGRQPAAIIAMHANHELRVCLDDGEQQQLYTRPVEALDDIAALEQELCAFLHECQLPAVHVIATLQADEVGGQQHVCGLDAALLAQSGS